MALTRKFLSAMGIDEEKIEQIISAHTEVTNGLKEERDKYKEDADKYSEVKKELNELKKETAKADEKDPWKVKYDALKEEYDGYKSEIQAKQTEANKAKALKALLKDIGVSEKRIDAVARVTDLKSINLDENGKIEKEEELKTSLKKEWSDFITTTSEQGAKVPNPPSANNPSGKTAEEIMKIKDTAQRQAEIAKNLSAFGH